MERNNKQDGATKELDVNEKMVGSAQTRTWWYDVAQHIITMLSTKEAQLDTLGIRAKSSTGITLSQFVMVLITLQDLRFDMKTRRKEQISEHMVTFEDKK